MASQPEGKITLKGGCHCGFITYTARTTLTPKGNLSATRCNCTFCQNLGYTALHLTSASDFILHTPSSLTDAQLGDYAPRVKSVHRYFCRECGSHVCMQGEYPMGDGKAMPVMAVNLGSVKVGELPEGVEMARTEIGYFDMLRGNAEGGLRDRPWDGGLA